jgi:hypothetical protein
MLDCLGENNDLSKYTNTYTKFQIFFLLFENKEIHIVKQKNIVSLEPLRCHNISYKKENQENMVEIYFVNS